MWTQAVLNKSFWWQCSPHFAVFVRQKFALKLSKSKSRSDRTSGPETISFSSLRIFHASRDTDQRLQRLPQISLQIWLRIFNRSESSFIFDAEINLRRNRIKWQLHSCVPGIHCGQFECDTSTFPPLMRCQLRLRQVKLENDMGVKENNVNKVSGHKNTLFDAHTNTHLLCVCVCSLAVCFFLFFLWTNAIVPWRVGLIFCAGANVNGPPENHSQLFC